MIIATHSYGPDEWVKMRTFAWWVEILYLLRKLVQLPLLLIHMLTGLSYRQIFEFYAFVPFAQAPLLSELQRFLLGKAEAIRAGETELCIMRQGKDPYWLNVSDFIVTGLYSPELSAAFYAEQKTVLAQLLARHGKQLPAGLLEQAVALSEALFQTYTRQQPFGLTLRYNLWEACSDFLRGQPWQIRQGVFHHIHDWAGPPHYQVRMEAGPITIQQPASFK
ncbi:MAG: hypothetical protein CVV27_17800 [Candidatus Melainabacteria bacterium HGW-Melainabacteria-1]|nr:MAG: hypothetical protein CVV27_17800 [Candidatus Melainabacteria bacterium HGW-Melainabacteria-1]